MALSRHQEHILHHRCNIWRRANPAQGGHYAPSGAAYVLLHSDVPCHFHTGKGMSTPRGIGRTDYDIMLTADEVHFGADMDIKEGDVLVNTTDGDARYGMYYIVEGEPQIVGAVGRRYSGSKTVMAARSQSAPDGVG